LFLTGWVVKSWARRPAGPGSASAFGKPMHTINFEGSPRQNAAQRSALRAAGLFVYPARPLINSKGCRKKAKDESGHAPAGICSRHPQVRAGTIWPMTQMVFANGYPSCEIFGELVFNMVERISWRRRLRILVEDFLRVAMPFFEAFRRPTCRQPRKFLCLRPTRTHAKYKWLFKNRPGGNSFSFL